MWDKIWEWPGNEATLYVLPYTDIGNVVRFTVATSPVFPCKAFSGQSLGRSYFLLLHVCNLGTQFFLIKALY